MAVTTRAAHFTNSGQTAIEFRQQQRYWLGSRAGVFRTTSTSLKVTEKSGTPNMSVDVAAGACSVKGTEGGNTGSGYFVEAQSTTNVVISASDPTNARKDLLVVRIKDQDFASGSPSTNTATIEVVTGTPAASPADPTIPDNCVVLARVTVAAASTSVTNANITDLRYAGFTTSANQDNGGLVFVGGIIPATSTARPQAPVEGMVMYEDDTDALYTYNGSSWVSIATLGSEYTYTPVVTQSATPTITVNDASYQKVGRRVLGTVLVSVSSGTGTAGNAVTCTLPVNIGTSNGIALGHGYLFDSSASSYYPCIAYRSGTATCSFVRTAHEGTTPFLGVSGFSAALATGDILTFTFSYPAST